MSCFLKQDLVATLLQLSFIDRLIKGENPEEIINDLCKGYDELHEKKKELLEEVLSLPEKKEFRGLTNQNVWVFISKLDAYLEDVAFYNKEVLPYYGSNRQRLSITYIEQSVEVTLASIEILEALLKHYEA